MTWEDAILWLRAQDDQRELVRQCYYDDPLEAAAERFFSSAEWMATCRLLRSHLPCRVLDVGAGRGIVSYAFARTGCSVTAVEPGASTIVGRGAIQRLMARMATPVRVVDARGEALPFGDGAFDVVYGRAVLHHAAELGCFCREAARVLRPGGIALFVREHVISRRDDLAAFRLAHPLHPLCGGENAHTVATYAAALKNAGLRLKRMIGPLENVVNYFPAEQADVDGRVTSWLAGRLVGSPKWRGRLARWLLTIPGCRPFATRLASRSMDTPGRLFAFLGVKS
jgi:SAM-dependent methyltransferase